ncbi:MAG: peptide/nickel transport system substrate-binding protein [Acidimicrobiaceae bacterium]|nr:peptide/nickel transport system substrate-binding protein [Acidimicrobiaceae bacterium]
MHRRHRRHWLAVASATVLAVVVAACTGGGSKPVITTTTTLRPAATITQGGDITVAAEGEPGCMDWISTCTGSAWGVWTVETNTMPRAYDFTRDNQYKPSILLTAEADVQTSPEQVVTYRLNPRAVWSDGQPITSHDFKYTWDQVAHGQNIQDQSGYKNIVTVDDSDPHVAVVTFSQPFADWRRLFGGSSGLLPAHILEGNDRDALMKDGYDWSGGPWRLALGGWSRGQGIKLVPNVNYWGKKPDLASVTFRIFHDAAAEAQAFTDGQVVAAYPAPEPASLAYRSIPGALYSLAGGLDYQALWFDVAQPAVVSKSVREAVAYSLDRAAIVSQTVGQLFPAAAPLQSFVTPAAGTYYTESFAKYHQDLATAAQLMQSDGYAKGADGMWARSTQKATIDVKVSTASARDQEAAALIKTQLQAAGFVVTVTPEDPQTVLAKDVPAGMFTVALYPFDFRRQLTAGVPAGAGIDDNDPGMCRLFCSANIAVAGSGGAGTNNDRISDPTLDRYLSDLDTNLSDDARLTDVTQAGLILADLVPAIPIAALPDIVVVNTSKMAVEGGTFSHNLAYGPYEYLNEWYLK